MERSDGERVVEVAVDALSKALEYVDDPSMLAISVVIVVEDGEGNIIPVAHCWPKPEIPS